jgi:hypothetical protein
VRSARFRGALPLKRNPELKNPEPYPVCAGFAQSSPPELTSIGWAPFQVALAVERAGAAGTLRNHHVLWIHTLNTMGAVLVPCAIIVNWHPDLLVSMLFMLVVLTLAMKLVSYAHVNHDLRVRTSPSAPRIVLVECSRASVSYQV